MDRRSFLKAAGAGVAIAATGVTPALARSSDIVVAHDGTIRPFADRRRVPAVAWDVRDGRIVAVGGEAMALLRFPEVRRMPLGGRCLLPGLIDAHSHWLGDHAIPDPPLPDHAAGVAAAAAGGWTTITENFANDERLQIAVGLESEGRLPVRLHGYVPVNYQEQRFEDWKGWSQDLVLSDRVRVSGTKLFIDSGAVGWTREPYDDDPTERGTGWWDDAELTAQVDEVLSRGFRLVVHAMGDAAIAQILDVLEPRIPAGNPARHQLTHLLVLDDGLLARVRAAGLVAVPQFSWCHGDWVPFVEPHLGPSGRIAHTGRWLDLVRSGIHVAGSTDWPWSYGDVGPVPLTLHQAVTRRGGGGAEPHAVWADQRLTIAQTLRALTRDAAWALGREADLGTLERGKLADLTLLSDDPFRVGADGLLGLRVDATIVGGAVAHGAV